ncbi:SIS domain-containing protein [Marmoricola sp. RAF53]|uniref:SIS domain-containing protein n=1 Tax=Marmoricola sp. RAF53 TaxID=3233059 RepID=UPI003F9D13C2
MVFDDGLLDDEEALRRAEPALRNLAEGGARVRREAVSAAESLAAAVEVLSAAPPRAVVAAGPDSRLLRAVLEPTCPVPFVAWPGPGLPGWAGALDLVVVLAPDGNDPGTAAGVAEAVRRGCPLVVATPEDSLVGRHTPGRYSNLLPTVTGDQLATAVVMLELMDRLGLGPDTDAEVVAVALDDVALACGPYRDLAVNPAKILASGIAETSPLLWGGTVLAARAARRVAESLRRATGRAALAADAEHLLPVLAGAPPADVFADPFADEASEPRPSLLVLDDGSPDPVVAETRSRLTEQADAHGIRVETVTAAGDGAVASYASLLATGTFAAHYLEVGLAGD